MWASSTRSVSFCLESEGSCGIGEGGDFFFVLFSARDERRRSVAFGDGSAELRLLGCGFMIKRRVLAPCILGRRVGMNAFEFRVQNTLRVVGGTSAWHELCRVRNAAM